MHPDIDQAIAEAEHRANPAPLDRYENALVQYLKRTPTGHKLSDVCAI